MTPDKLLVLIGSAGIIGFIYWFFLGNSESSAGEVQSDVLITADGGYSPAAVKVPAGKKITLRFLRKDPSDCMEELVIPDLKIKRSLQIGREEIVELKIDRPGQYDYHCGMNMYRGRIIAV